MATDVQNIVIGAEAVVHFGDQDWCITDLSLNIEKTQQEVTTTCDFVANETPDTGGMVYVSSKTTKKRLTGSFTINRDRTVDPMPVFNDAGDDAVEGYIQLDTGLRFTGTWQIGNLSFTGGSPDGVQQIQVPFASQGPYTIGAAPP
jgi:hypothetical protein